MLAIFRATWQRCLTTVAKVRHFWSDEGPGGDCFWLLDVALLLGGMQSATTSQWKRERYVRYWANGVFAYIGFVFLLHSIHALQSQEDAVAGTVWEIMKIVVWSVAASRVLMNSLRQRSITAVRNFIVNSTVDSGDREFDELEQRKFNRYARTVMRVLLSLYLVDTVLASVPNAATEKAFELPPELRETGHYVSIILRCLEVNFIPVVIGSKLFSTLSIEAPLLLGMRAKLRMLAHRYDRMLTRPPLENDEQYLERLDREVRDTLNLQRKIWIHLRTVKDLIAKDFVLVHYFSNFTIAASIYVIKNTGINTCAMMVASGSVSWLLEYYAVCRLVDALQDEADSICKTIFELCARMPYVRGQHSRYVQMRATFMIASMKTRNGVAMSCFGLFKISTVAFVAMINIAYSVLKFLISVG